MLVVVQNAIFSFSDTMQRIMHHPCIRTLLLRACKSEVVGANSSMVRTAVFQVIPYAYTAAAAVPYDTSIMRKNQNARSSTVLSNMTPDVMQNNARIMYVLVQYTAVGTQYSTTSSTAALYCSSTQLLFVLCCTRSIVVCCSVLFCSALLLSSQGARSVAPCAMLLSSAQKWNRRICRPAQDGPHRAAPVEIPRRTASFCSVMYTYDIYPSMLLLLFLLLYHVRVVPFEKRLNITFVLLFLYTIQSTAVVVRSIRACLLQQQLVSCDDDFMPACNSLASIVGWWALGAKDERALTAVIFSLLFNY